MTAPEDGGPRPLRISVLAQSLRVAGGRAVGLGLLGGLARQAGEHAYQCIVPAGVGYESLAGEFPCGGLDYVGQLSRWQRWRYEQWTLPRAVARFKPDVVLGLQGLGLSDPPAAQVLFPQDSHLFYPVRHFADETALHKLGKRYNRLQLARHLKRTALILCQTEVVERRIRETFGYRGAAWVCGSAVAPSLAARREAPPVLRDLAGRFKLLYLSKYSAHKNFEGVLEAYRSAGERLRDTATIVTVSADQHPRAGRFLKSLAGLEDRIINVGTIPPDEVGAYYAHCDAFLMPSRLETLGLPYIEAMTCGLPIATSDLDFAHAVCGDAALYFDAWNSSAMADAMIRLQRDPALRGALAAAGRARAARMFRSWDDIARELIVRLSALVRDQPRGGALSHPHVTFVGVRPPRDHSVSRVAWRLWLSGVSAAFLLYFTTASRGAQWQDSGWQQYRITTGELEHPRGLALSHPLQYYFGRLSLAISGQRPAFAITLVSVVAGAIAVGNVAAAGYLLSGSAAAAAISALALMLAHTFWKFSCLTESYALVAALQSGKWLAMAWAGRTGHVWGLWLAALCNGLGVANHMLAGLGTPILAALAVWLWRFGRLRTRDLAVGGVLWCIGTLPYSGLVLAELFSGVDLGATLRSATVGSFGEAVLNTSITARLLAMSVGCMIYNLPGLTFVWAILARPGGALAPRAWVYALWLEAALYLLFSVRYPIVDQYTFFIPTYVAAALLAPIALAGVMRRVNARTARAWLVATALTAAWSPLIYVGTTEVLRRTGWLGSLVRNKPYRDGYGWFLLPWERWNRYADQLNEAIAAHAGEHGLVLIEDHMQGFGVRFAAAAGEIPPGVQLIEAAPHATDAEKSQTLHAFAAAVADGVPVLLVPYDRDQPRWQPVVGQWHRAGDIYVLDYAGR